MAHAADTSTLVALRPPTGTSCLALSSRSTAGSCGRLGEELAKSINPLLRHEVEGVHRLGSLGYQTGPSEPQLTTSGRATCTIRFPLTKSQQNVTGPQPAGALTTFWKVVTLTTRLHVINGYQPITSISQGYLHYHTERRK
eukprot:scaffold11174_cov56-Phaeocystis_antarctica.AAC.1